MNGGEENLSFLDYILSSELRFLGERNLGLDLYHSGMWGVGVFCLTVASATVFLLAIFHLIPSRKHVVSLLLGLGGLAALLGLSGSYLHFDGLPEVGVSIIRETAGQQPLTLGQQAVIVTLPLLLGSLTLAMDVLGCAYMAIFWSGSLLRGERSVGSGG